MAGRRSQWIASCLIAAALTSVTASAAAGALPRLFLETRGHGVLAAGTKLSATGDYTLGTNGSCPIALSGPLSSNGQVLDMAQLAIDPGAPCGAEQTQPAGSPWRLKLAAGGKFVVEGAKALVIDRGGSLQCVYEAARAIGKLSSLTPVRGSAAVTMFANRKLSAAGCPKSAHFTFTLARLAAGTETVEGEVH
jgi:hypothetical protein